jgi:putative tryptophan/tyrosine transport system substrate-binding protein
MQGRPSRRQFVQGAGAVGLALVAGCGRRPGQEAPPPPTLARIGYLASGPSAVSDPELDAFRDELGRLGWVGGHNLELETRFIERRPDRMPELAAELASSPVDIMVVPSEPAARAAQAANSTIPIVMAASIDPVALGIIASLARPGGMVTGLATLDQELSGKRLELLKASAPGVSRVAFLGIPTSPHYPILLRAMQRAAEASEVRIRLIEVNGPGDFERAFEAVLEERAEALLFQDTQPLILDQRGQLLDFVAKNRLPTIHASRRFVEGGGLMSYGPSMPELHRRAATYVDKILKGAKPADLPVEQPREFEFVINLRTAQLLGLTVPPHVLAQATEVIQ